MTANDRGDGRRQPTIFDVAKAAGVSKSLVSRVMRGSGSVSEEKAELVRQAAARLGYVPSAMAQGLASSRSNTIGVILRDAKLPFYGFLHSELQKCAREQGYQVVAITGVGELSAADVRDALRDLIALRVDGLVIGSAQLAVDDFLPYSARIPIVLAGHEDVTGQVSSVFCDERDGGGSLARFVFDYGHRDVAVFMMTRRYSLSQYTRGVAMVETLRELGASVRVIEMDGAERIGEHVDEAMCNPRTTAYMCPSDQCMYRVLEALRVRGIAVPDQISVTGYDGIGDLASPYFGFTTYRQPMEAMAAGAIDRLVRAIRVGGAGVDRAAIKGGLVHGRTVTAPRFN